MTDSSAILTFSNSFARADYAIIDLISISSSMLNAFGIFYYSYNLYINFRHKSMSPLLRDARILIILVNALSTLMLIACLLATHAPASNVFLAIRNWSLNISTLLIVFINMQSLLIFDSISPVKMITRENLIQWRLTIALVHVILCILMYLEYVAYSSEASLVTTFRVLGFVIWVRISLFFFGYNDYKKH